MGGRIVLARTAGSRCTTASNPTIIRPVLVSGTEERGLTQDVLEALAPDEPGSINIMRLTSGKEGRLVMRPTPRANQVGDCTRA